MEATDIAVHGERSAIGRLLALADRPGTEVRSGEGWVALRTGLASPDLNGVVSLGADVDEALVAELDAWWAEVPACWLVPDPDPGLTALLRDAGWHPATTGGWAGRDLGGDLPSAQGAIPMGDPADHLDVLQACGSIEPAERRGRRTLLTPHPLWHHVVVRRGTRAVGAASGFLGAGLEVVDLAVVPEERRTGVGTALLGALVAWARERGAEHVVAATGSDGAPLLAAHGFVAASVTADVRSQRPGR